MAGFWEKPIGDVPVWCNVPDCVIVKGMLSPIDGWHKPTYTHTYIHTHAIMTA